uniref:transcription repressor OFP1-like n=1 Tax=Erigeron canadensis TaxID=72917 RepID=UPI001CB8DF74|nr:transcription repressor OFP1-like [Erigeron canadensis]
MGNYRFRLSDMIPNAWFYKLKDMSKTKTHQRKPQSSSSSNYIYSPSTITKQPQNNQHFSQPRNSIYYTPKASQFHYNSSSPKFPHFHDPQKKSSKNKVPKPNRKTIYKPSPKHTHSTQPLQDFFHSPNVSPCSTESTQSELATASWCTTCRLSSSTSDIIIDINDTKKSELLSSSPEKDLKLPPIITKQSKQPISRNKQISHSSSKKLVNQTPARKSISNGVKLRANSPKLAVSKRLIAAQRKNLTESFAIVKSSFDPQKDFMESMMEMIIENNIKSSKDLEELLACYLSLNSAEYHDVIVKAFEQIWFTLPNL